MKRAGSLAFVALLLLGGSAWSLHSDTFAPEHRLSGIGVDRKDMPFLVLEARTQRMIDAQTFIIMREPEALAIADCSKTWRCMARRATHSMRRSRSLRRKALSRCRTQSRKAQHGERRASL